MTQRIGVGLAAGLAGAALCLGSAGAFLVQPEHPAPQPPALENGAIRLADELSNAFEHAAEAIRPSVVSIASIKRVRVGTRQQTIPPAFEDLLRDHFGDDFFFRQFRFPGGEGSRDYIQQGQGAGFVVSEDGYLLTNNHVVEDATEVTVRFDDGREFIARVVGTDPQTDIAVLKIDATGLTPARLGDSDDIRVGQWVVAAGSPFGLSSSITAGIISAKGRTSVGILGSGGYEDFIQTDAAINPGNSGGPLVNLRGEVIGINTAIFTRTGGNMGIGFAVPINMARHVMESLITDGRVVRGYLGVVLQDLTPDLASSFGYDGRGGVLIGQVNEDSPASRAGLQTGDILTTFNGEPIRNMSSLRLKIASTPPGTRAQFEVFREGQTQTVEVEIGELPSSVVMAGSSRPAEASEERLGLTVQPLTRNLAAQLGLERGQTGVVVTRVEPLSAAARAGLRPGDVIIQVQGKPITDLQALRRAFSTENLREGVRMLVRNGDTTRFVVIRTRD